jgi:hypothetical protein
MAESVSWPLRYPTGGIAALKHQMTNFSHGLIATKPTRSRTLELHSPQRRRETTFVIQMLYFAGPARLEAQLILPIALNDQ